MTGRKGSMMGEGMLSCGRGSGKAGCGRGDGIIKGAALLGKLRYFFYSLEKLSNGI